MNDKGWAVYWALVGLAKPWTIVSFLRDRRRAEREWAETLVSPLEDLGSCSRLSVLPAVEYYAAGKDSSSARRDLSAGHEDPSDSGEHLATEAGVSYLLRIDDKTWLFDVGLNARHEHPSPLLRNLEALGFSPADLDAIFISHLHLDHVGGPEEMKQGSFSLSAGPVELPDLVAYVPTVMRHPQARVEVVTAPRKLAEGVASTGPLTRAIWKMGPIQEHSLLINVAGKGIVMVVGCGHPTLARLVARAKAVTALPLYGVIGGLHFPVTGSRVGKGGQNIIGNGKLPWQRITRREAEAAAAFLADLDLGLVAVSGHDSCDWSLGLFQSKLGERCRTLQVGKEIVIA